LYREIIKKLKNKIKDMPLEKTKKILVRLTEEQYALLQSLMREKLETKASLFLASLLVQVRDCRANHGKSGPGRPKKLDPANDPNAPRTIPNPFTQEHELINLYELEVARALRGAKNAA